MIPFSFSRILIMLAAFMAIMIVYEICIIYHYIRISTWLVAKAQPYVLTSSTDWPSILVLGDSTAVGVWADTASDSTAGRLAKYIGAKRVEHHGVSWAIVADIGDQLTKIEKKEYDYILLQIGANDMVAFHNLETVSRDYEVLLENLPKAKKLIVLSCGNLGWAKIFPRIMGVIYEHLSRSYHAKLWAIVAKHWGIYINLFEERSVDPFVLQPDVYLAADYFHPSSIWYAHWFSSIVKQIESSK